MSALLRRLLQRAIERSPRLRGAVAGALGRQLTDLDLDFLRALPDGLVVDLDRQLDASRASPDLPSVFWSMLWEASAARRLGASCPKRVEFRLGGRRFTMELDLAESPECGYLLRNPTVAITRRLLAGGETMLDIGANAGFHALSAALFFRRVVACEPTPATADRLARNVAISGFDHVTVERIALSDRAGEALLRIERGHCGSNRLGSGDAEGIRVPIETLDALDARSRLGRVDFIKIDVEGHECEVAAGARSVLERDRPTLMVEFNTPELFERFRTLLPSGYRSLHDRPDGTTGPIASGNEAVAARDVMFVGRDGIR